MQVEDVLHAPLDPPAHFPCTVKMLFVPAGAATRWGHLGQPGKLCKAEPPLLIYEAHSESAGPWGCLLRGTTYLVLTDTVLRGCELSASLTSSTSFCI